MLLLTRTWTLINILCKLFQFSETDFVSSRCVYRYDEWQCTLPFYMLSMPHINKLKYIYLFILTRFTIYIATTFIFFLVSLTRNCNAKCDIRKVFCLFCLLEMYVLSCLYCIYSCVSLAHYLWLYTHLLTKVLHLIYCSGILLYIWYCWTGETFFLERTVNEVRNCSVTNIFIHSTVLI